MPPLLDVSDVLDDPDFMSSLSCVRNAQTVGSDGRATNTPTTTAFTGVVTADRGNVLERLAEGSRITGGIFVHSHFALRAGVVGGDADVVIWKGRSFTVTEVFDYSDYGAGFTCAKCEPIGLRGN